MSFDIKFTRQCFSLPSDSTCVLEAKPGKRDIKRREPGIFYQVTSWFTLQTSDYVVIIDVRGDSMSLTTSLNKFKVTMT